jgi:hypothetical protein
MDLGAFNNDRFQLTLDLTNWALVVDLTAGAFKMHIRSQASSPTALLDFQSGGSTAQPDCVIGYSTTTHLAVMRAPVARVAAMGGVLSWDFGFQPTGQDFIRFDGGAITLSQGVTRFTPPVSPSNPASVDTVIITAASLAQPPGAPAVLPLSLQTVLTAAQAAAAVAAAAVANIQTFEALMVRFAADTIKAKAQMFTLLNRAPTSSPSSIIPALIFG